MARILVVDDNSDLLEMIRVLLEDQGGHEAILSVDGEEALEKAFAAPPDLAIIDVMMPGMTGYEVCRTLRATPATADIPIIILTARGQEVDRQAALDAGASLHIVKPVTMSELLDQVDHLLGGGGTPSGEGTPNRTMAMLSLRGGVGVTTLAVNTAAFLASRTGQATCLVDLCPSSGNAALQLGLRPEPSWLELVTSSGNVDPTELEACLLLHSTGLRLLSSPFVPLTNESLSKEISESVLRSLKQRFPWVVLDLPSVLNDAVLAALDSVDAIALLLTFDPASIQATLGTMQAIKTHSDKVRVILNQVAPGQQPPVQALERVLRTKLSGRVPFDPDQAQALTKGQPLALTNPESPLVQTVPQLVTALRPDST
jgi:pilus assembly protein CpaE